MTVSEVLFTDPGHLAVRKGTIDLENDTIVCVLVTSAHTPSLINDNIYSDISGSECADADYTATFAEGHVLASSLWSAVSTRVVKWDAADLDYGNAVTITAQYVYIVRRAGASLVAGDLIVGYVDLNEGVGDVSSTAGNFDLAWAATGLFVDTLSP